MTKIHSASFSPYLITAIPSYSMLSFRSQKNPCFSLYLLLNLYLTLDPLTSSLFPVLFTPLTFHVPRRFQQFHQVIHGGNQRGLPPQPVLSCLCFPFYYSSPMSTSTTWVGVVVSTSVNWFLSSSSSSPFSIIFLLSFFGVDARRPRTGGIMYLPGK